MKAIQTDKAPAAIGPLFPGYNLRQSGLYFRPDPLSPVDAGRSSAKTSANRPRR